MRRRPSFERISEVFFGLCVRVCVCGKSSASRKSSDAEEQPRSTEATNCVETKSSSSSSSSTLRVAFRPNPQSGDPHSGRIIIAFFIALLPRPALPTRIDVDVGSFFFSLLLLLLRWSEIGTWTPRSQAADYHRRCSAADMQMRFGLICILTHTHTHTHTPTHPISPARR